MAGTSLDAEQLHDALQVFNREFGLLEASYRDLRESVDALATQLCQKNAALRADRSVVERLAGEART